MLEFLGHLHPVILHLPIGILVMGMALYFWYQYNPEKKSDTTLRFTFQLAFFSGILACITGYLLKDSGGYGADLVEWHQWSAIALTALVGVYIYVPVIKKYEKVYLLGLAGLLTFTGHQGGSLTHGEDFLSFKTKKERAPIENIEEALVYQDVIEPILEEKCYQCHSSRKQKGDLRLDSKEAILKGGEEGPVLLSHRPIGSPIYQRLLLPESQEEHMPPKGKPQPTEDEIKLIEWWVINGGDFEKKVSEISERSNVSKALAQLENPTIQEVEDFPLIPTEPVDPVANLFYSFVDSLRISAVPVSQNSNYLSVNFLGKKHLGCKNLEFLKEAQEQITWLKLNDTSVDDACVEVIAGLENLVTLDLSGTAISNEGVKVLSRLENLQSLYLVNTNVSNEGILALQKLPALRNLYLFQSSADFASLSKQLPHVDIDTGGYSLPFLATDTTMLVGR